MTRIEELRAAIDDGVATESEVLEFDDLKHAVDCPPPRPREWWIDRLGPLNWDVSEVKPVNSRYIHVLESTPARLAAEELLVALEDVCSNALDDSPEMWARAEAALAKAKAGGAGG